MNSRMVALAVGLFATFVVTIVSAANADSAPTSSPTDSLPDLCQKARADFRPLTQNDVEQAKTVLVDATKRLDERLSLAGPNGDDWRKYLELAALQDQLRRAAGPDRAVLERIHSRFTAGYEGLELVWFLDVTQALHNYLATASAVDNPKVRTSYEERLDKLAATLERYAVKPTTDDALLISETVRWLQDARQAPVLIDGIERRYVHPNVYGQVSAEIVGAGIAGPVDEITAVRDCILGTDMYGTAHTIGQITTQTAPCDTVGVLDAIFYGHAASEAVGYHGKITVCSTSSTSLAGLKRVWADANGLHSCPATANAVTKATIQDIQSCSGRKMIENMAWKRACKQLSTAECIASRHAEVQLGRRIDERAAAPLERANQAYMDKFYRPFTERKIFPQDLRLSSTERAILVLALQSGGGKLAAPGEPPPDVEGADMSVRIHESMINNLSFDALAGRTAYEEKLQQAAIDVYGYLPDKMKGDEDGKPWAITFAARQPISVTFADDGFKITIRGVKYYKGNDAYPGMNVSAAYKIEHTASGFKAVRQGDIEVLPPDYVPGKQVRRAAPSHPQTSGKTLRQGFRARVFGRRPGTAGQMEGGRQAPTDPSNRTRRLAGDRLETARYAAEGCHGRRGFGGRLA